MKEAASKRKHITLTIQEKIDIINLCEEGKVSRAAVAAQFGIGKSTVHDICKNAEKIRAFASDNQNEILKRRRVDQKLVKYEEQIVHEEQTEETVIDSIEEYEYRDIDVQDYQIVYETSYPTASANQPQEQPLQKSSKYNSSKATRNSKTLTFKEKYDIIQQFEAGKTVAAIRQVYGIGRTTIYDFVKQKSKIYEFLAKSNENHQRRTFKKSKFPEVEKRLVQWCNSQQTYTKQKFNEHAKRIFEKAKEEGSISSPSGFCGSWAWAKRFFHRNPGLESKLRTPLGEALDPAELSISNVEFLYNDDANDAENGKASKQKPSVLTLAEKLQVLDDIDDGNYVSEIANKFEISKAMIRSIFKERDIIRLQGRDKEKPISTYPSLNSVLAKWCSEQKNRDITLEILSEKAVEFFGNLNLVGSLNVNTWIDNFLAIHPEIEVLEQVDDLGHSSQDGDMELEDVESFDENPTVYFEEDDDMSGTLEFLEPEALASEYQEECIIEELDSHHEDQNDAESAEEIIKIENIDVVSIEAAQKSLQLLMRFCEQQGHDEMLSHLADYQSQL